MISACNYRTRTSIEQCSFITPDSHSLSFAAMEGI